MLIKWISGELGGHALWFMLDEVELRKYEILLFNNGQNATQARDIQYKK